MCITLRNSDDLRPRVERILDRLFARIGALLPDAELHHIGATALLGALTKGDIDILLRVPLWRFPGAVDVFRAKIVLAIADVVLYYLKRVVDLWKSAHPTFQNAQ